MTIATLADSPVTTTPVHDTLRPAHVRLVPAPCSTDALGEEIAALAARLHAATYELLVLVREFDARTGWGNGFASCAHWLHWRTGIALGAAREKVRVAHALATLPRVSITMQRGAISYAKVRALTRIATPENEAALLDFAQAGTAAHVERLAGAWRRVDQVAAAKAEARHLHRHLSTWVDDDGMVVIRGRLTPEVGAVVQRALEAATDRLFREAREVPKAESLAEEVTPAQRRADALGLLAETALTSDLDRGSAGDRYQVVLHVDAPTGVVAGAGRAVAAGEGQSGALEVDYGAVDVSAETSRRLACDAAVVQMTHAPDGAVLDVGRKTRTVPPSIRRALQARDHTCRFPGCTARRCDAHHVEHWVDGGSTSLDNLVLLCRRHHRTVHEGGFAVRQLTDGTTTFLRPDGSGSRRPRHCRSCPLSSVRLGASLTTSQCGTARPSPSLTPSTCSTRLQLGTAHEIGIKNHLNELATPTGFVGRWNHATQKLTLSGPGHRIVSRGFAVPNARRVTPLHCTRGQSQMSNARNLAPFMAVAFAVAGMWPGSPQAQSQEFRITLLGTGSVAPVLDRLGPAILVEAGSERLLFDAGRGVLQRLHQAHARDVSRLFLTHLHSDHVVGIPDLYLIGWGSRRQTPLQVWGPAGTVAMMGHVYEAFAFDRQIRIEDDGSSPDGAKIEAHDVGEGVVHERAGLKVTAFVVDHGPVKPALGYRVDYGGRAAVFSGDTRFSQNLIEHAKGADLVVHEVSASRDPTQTQENNRVLAHHTLPDQAGTAFSLIHPQMAVYSHVGTGGDPNGRGLSDAELIAATRKTYDGPLLVAHDLMTFRIGATVIVSDVKPDF